MGAGGKKRKSSLTKLIEKYYDDLKELSYQRVIEPAPRCMRCWPPRARSMAGR